MSNIALRCLLLALVMQPYPAFAQNPLDQMRGMIEQLKNSVNLTLGAQQPAQQSTGQPSAPAPSVAPTGPVPNQPQPNARSESDSLPSCSQIKANPWGRDNTKAALDQEQWYFGKRVTDYSTAELQAYIDKAFACASSAPADRGVYQMAINKANGLIDRVKEYAKRQADEANSKALIEAQKTAEAQRRAQQAQEKAAEEAKEAADSKTLAERQQKLKTGAAKITSIDDAKLFYAPVKDLLPVMESPLLTPDGAIYSGNVILDLQEKPGVIRGKTVYVLAYPHNLQIAYVLLQTTKATVNFSPESMRIGGIVQVLGRYIQNAQYQTVAGETKTAPILDVLYFGKRYSQ